MLFLKKERFVKQNKVAGIKLHSLVASQAGTV